MNTLHVWGQRTLECVLHALAMLNRGTDDLTIRAISGNASKGLDVAYILNREFGIDVGKIEMKRLPFDDIETFCVEITLKGLTTESHPPVQDDHLAAPH